MIRIWKDKPPDKCEMCGKPLRKSFIDGKTVFGYWTILCVPCHKARGCGLGANGKKYWIKGGENVSSNICRRGKCGQET